MTIAYLIDTFTSLGPTPGTYQSMLRVQWIGIAYMPVALTISPTRCWRRPDCRRAVAANA